MHFLSHCKSNEGHGSALFALSHCIWSAGRITDLDTELCVEDFSHCAWESHSSTLCSEACEKR